MSVANKGFSEQARMTFLAQRGFCMRSIKIYIKNDMFKEFAKKQFAHFRAIKTESLRLYLMWIAVFISIVFISYADSLLEEIFANSLNFTLLIAPFGASAVILFSAPQSPIAQPRNVILGHSSAAFIGVLTALIMGYSNPLATGVSVASALIYMLLANCLHPPAGATALFAVIGGTGVQELGFLYVIFPCAIGAIILVLLAKILNYLIDILCHLTEEEEKEKREELKSIQEELEEELNELKEENK